MTAAMLWLIAAGVAYAWALGRFVVGVWPALRPIEREPGVVLVFALVAWTAAVIATATMLYHLRLQATAQYVIQRKTNWQ